MSRIVISDIHGCYDTLMALVAKLPPDVPIIFAGDLIDRGAESCKVIEYIKSSGYDCVLGNHEVMMLRDLEFRTREDGTEQVVVDHDSVWLYNGGERALKSYLTADGTYDIPKMKEHLEWLKSLPYHKEYMELKDSKGQHLLVTHSTAAHVWGEYSPENPAFIEAVTWDRDPMPPKIDGIFNCYGHTPQKNGATVKDHFACIDTGACYTKYNDYSRLTALQFPEMQVYTQESVEK